MRSKHSILLAFKAFTLAVGYFVLVGISKINAAEIMIQFEGSLEFVQQQLESDPIVEHLLFRAEVSDCRWRIRTAQTDAGLTNTAGAYCSYSYDGSFLYRLSSLGPGPTTGKPSASDPVQKTAIISRGEFPQFDPSRVSLVWIGLASKCYLAIQNNARCKPVWAASQASFTDDRGFLKTEIEPLEHGFFAKRILFLTDGSAFIDIPNPPNYEVKYPSPFDRGFIKAQYEVTAVRDFKGLSYPGEFSLVVYNPKSDGKNSNDLHTAWQVRGKILQAKQLAFLEDIRPETSGLMQVIDYRSATNGLKPFQYLVDKWKDDSDLQLRNNLNRHIELQRKKEQHATASKIIVWIAFIFTAVAAAFLVLRGRKNNQQDKNKKT